MINFFFVLLLSLSSLLEGIVQTEKNIFSEAHPGQIHTTKLLISNPEDREKTFRLSLSDWQSSKDGSHAFLPPGTLERSLAPWLHLSLKVVTLPPQSTKEVQVTISIPKDPHLLGSYWTLVLIEPEEHHNYPGIHVNVRFAELIVVTLGNPAPRLDLSKPVVSRETLHIELENTGDRYLHPTLEWMIYDQSGKLVFQKTVESQKLPPYCSSSLVLSGINLSPDRYKGVVFAKDQNKTLFGKNIEFNIDP